MKCQSFDWYLKNVYPELAIPGKEDKDAKKESTAKNKGVLNEKFQRRKYRQKNYVATYRVLRKNINVKKYCVIPLIFLRSTQIQLSGSDLCIESEKESTSKGSTLVLAKCSRSKKQVKESFTYFSFKTAKLMLLKDLVRNG